MNEISEEDEIDKQGQYEEIYDGPDSSVIGILFLFVLASPSAPHFSPEPFLMCHPFSQSHFPPSFLESFLFRVVIPGLIFKFLRLGPSEENYIHDDRFDTKLLIFLLSGSKT